MPARITAIWMLTILAGLASTTASCGSRKSGDPAERPVDHMVRVTAGPFQVGCSPHDAPPCVKETALPRQVAVPEYDIDVFEVTAIEFRSCVSAHACTPFLPPAELRDRQPALVSWAQAAGYCRWLGKELPMELQWEKAARGSDGRAYPWGDTPPTCKDAHYRSGCNGTNGEDADVGSFTHDRSPFGVFDMLGNAPEWVADAWTYDYRADAVSTMSPDPNIDRLVKPNLHDAPPCCALFHRIERSPSELTPDGRELNPGIGFRCARWVGATGAQRPSK